MGGREKGEMLVAGQGQTYSNTIAVNAKNNEKVGKGVYCSPLFTTALNEYTRPCRKEKETFHE